MELHMGKMTNQELADWFGIKIGSFKAKKKNKLEELKDYAEFDEVYGGVNIKDIYNETYSKKGSKAKQIIFESVPIEWDKSGLDTVANVTDKIYKKHMNELTVVRDTTYKYALQARNEFFGKPFLNVGSLGKCSYIWCKKEELEDGTALLTPFSEEEQAIKRELMKKYFSTDEEKDIMIAEMVKAGEISKADAYDLQCEYRGLNEEGFIGFKRALEEALGASVVKGTLVERNHETELKFLEAGDELIK